MIAGQLLITIVEARALDDKDTFGGLNDAYVQFFSRIEHDQNHIHIKVYDEDDTAGRDAIGSAKIDLEPVQASGYFDDWVKLPKLFGLGSNSQIHVHMHFQS
ncbi:unnamed protein product [Rotaria sordida]|uniref:C2 domain-containing protein n=1 Tax=Rotaria sordida TaxID=392033 RepID=A0A818PHF6_9BILA|nr:unnamed protein product [Rotaria sordida]CAF3623476.1 unnamed protein product [Rotaria sordida]